MSNRDEYMPGPASGAEVRKDGYDIRWKLEPLGDGTRLTLWHNIDRGFISMGAAGWHICLDVLDRLLADDPIGRIVGGEAMKFGWPRLNAEYAKRLVSEPQSAAKAKTSNSPSAGKGLPRKAPQTGVAAQVR